MPQRPHGGLRLSGRQGGGDGRDRHRRRRRRVRCGLRQRVCLECEWHAHRDSSRHSGPISRCRKRADAAGGTQHGARPNESPRVHRLREVWTSAGGCAWQRQATGAARIVSIDGHRARFVSTLTEWRSWATELRIDLKTALFRVIGSYPANRKPTVCAAPPLSHFDRNALDELLQLRIGQTTAHAATGPRSYYRGTLWRTRISPHLCLFLAHFTVAAARVLSRNRLANRLLQFVRRHRYKKESDLFRATGGQRCHRLIQTRTNFLATADSRTGPATSCWRSRSAP